MKKMLIGTLLVCSQIGLAYEYTCYHNYDLAPYDINKIKLVTNQDKVQMLFEGFESWEEYTIVDHSESDPTQVKFSLVRPYQNEYGEGPVEKFLADEALLKGGYKLKNGKIGGFMKTTGAGYSWAKYLCIRK